MQVLPTPGDHSDYHVSISLQSFKCLCLKLLQKFDIICHAFALPISVWRGPTLHVATCH